MKAKVNKAGPLPFDKGRLVSTKIDLSLNAQAFFDPVFKCYLNELKINLPNKSYSRDNRLNKLFKLTFSECFGTSMSAYLNQNL